jgi:transposase InsO family protein
MTQKQVQSTMNIPSERRIDNIGRNHAMVLPHYANLKPIEFSDAGVCRSSGASAPNHKWIADFTYGWTTEGCLTSPSCRSLLPTCKNKIDRRKGCAIELVVRKAPTGTLVSENERITAPVKGFSAVVYTRRGAVV